MASYQLLCGLTLMIILSSKGCDSQLSVCGLVTQNTRVVGGQTAPAGSWPWTVSIHAGSAHSCGGSLISSQWVLTAAHCLSGQDLPRTVIYLGRHVQQGANPTEESRMIEQIICHPDYDFFNHDNDICLLKLAAAVNFTDFIRPVCLAAANSSFHAGTDSWLTGWGFTRVNESLPPPQALQQAQVPVVGNRKCRCYNKNLEITENMICAGLKAGGKDACLGDSGGPLVSKQGGVWVQSGVVSFGDGCGRPNSPGVYARVSQYEEWINSHITTDQPGFVSFVSPGIDSDLNFTCPTAPPTQPTDPYNEDDSIFNGGVNTHVSCLTHFISFLLMLTLCLTVSDV